MSAYTRRKQYALPEPQPSKHEALNQRLVFAGSVERPRCVSHIVGCEDIKTVAQLMEHKDDLVTVDIKNG